ncbi:MAG: hypothetical protein ACFNTC_02130 [Prevotella sp.]
MIHLRIPLLVALTTLFVVACGSNSDADDSAFVVENTVYVQVQDEDGQPIDPDELLKDNKFSAIGQKGGKALDVRTEVMYGDKLLVFSPEFPLKHSFDMFPPSHDAKGVTRSDGRRNGITAEYIAKMEKRFTTGIGYSRVEMSIDGVQIPLIFYYGFYIDSSKFLSSGSLSDTGVELLSVYSGNMGTIPHMSFSYFRLELRKKGQGYTFVDPYNTSSDF